MVNALERRNLWEWNLKKERIVSWQRKRMETVTHLQDAQS